MQEITLHEFTTNMECMKLASTLVADGIVFNEVTAAEVITAINEALAGVGSPWKIKPEDDKIYFLRVDEGERFDRLIYILYCLVDFSKYKN